MFTIVVVLRWDKNLFEVEIEFIIICQWHEVCILLFLSSGFYLTFKVGYIIKLRLHKDSGLIMLLIKPTKTVSCSMTMRFWGIIKLTFKTSLYGLFNHRYITSVDSKSRWLRLKLTCFDWVINTVVEFQIMDAKKTHLNWKGSIHIWRQMFLRYFWPTYPNKIYFTT